MGKYQTPLVLICRQTDDDDVICASTVEDTKWLENPWNTNTGNDTE